MAEIGTGGDGVIGSPIAYHRALAGHAENAPLRDKVPRAG
jgi:hypothetical protein